MHALLALMRERGLDAASMEVSSHAISFHRVDGVLFDVAGFTNLTQDHLDLHGSMEEYFDTKARLFTAERARAAVVTVDDDWGRRLAARRPPDSGDHAGHGRGAPAPTGCRCDWTSWSPPRASGTEFGLHGTGRRPNCACTPDCRAASTSPTPRWPR